MSTFYFYDLETSGINPRTSRIMQFAGQRTDMDLKPIGKPDNILVKLSPDILPEPDAVLVHGITPQRALSEGVSEAELVKYLSTQVFLPNTIAVGFNNIRFDDEFIRFLFWRNFTDAYEWQWKEGRSRWDILDMSRMTRALRPEGLQWPFASDGRPTNNLAGLAAVNGLEHDSAHDALSDVRACMAVARLIYNKQPKLYDYLLSMRSKTKVAALLGSGQPFVYTSGRYSSEHEKTTIAKLIAPHPDRGAGIVYDLRVDPEEFIKMSPPNLAKAWQTKEPDAPYFPLKICSYNRCPAVAPVSVLDTASLVRLGIDLATVDINLTKLENAKDFGDKLTRALEIMSTKEQPQMVIDDNTVDSSLYGSFVPDADKPKMSVVRAASENELVGLNLDFSDDRLEKLLPLYKARNYPKSLSQTEQSAWQVYLHNKLLAGGKTSWAAKYFGRLNDLAKLPDLSRQNRYLLEELQLYGQSVLPSDSGQ